MTYGLDITNIPEDQRGDLSQRIHELMDTCLEIVKVAGNEGDLTVEILRDKGYDVQLYNGCGHCLQGMANTGGRCDCECHR